MADRKYAPSVEAREAAEGSSALSVLLNTEELLARAYAVDVPHFVARAEARLLGKIEVLAIANERYLEMAVRAISNTRRARGDRERANLAAFTAFALLFIDGWMIDLARLA